MFDELVSIAAVGDVMLGDRPLMVGLGVRSCIENSNSYDPFSEVGAYLKKQDIVFGNLESVISDDGINEYNYKSVQMRGASASVKLLKNAGFNIMSVANNHLMQHGDGAFFETIDLLKENGIDPLGCVDSYGKSIPKYKNIKGMILCFVGFSLRPEKYALKAKYAQGEFIEILKCVKEYKKKCDFLVLSLHWGDEYVFWPSKEQIRQARLLVDQGASLILGHHPHVVQGIEIYNNSIIAYSLGNFVFDVWQKRLRQTFILVIKLKKNLIPGFLRIPVCIDHKFRPKFVCKKVAQDFNKKFIKLDRMIEEYPYSLIPGCDGYREYVKYHEIKNKIENRLLFLRSVHKYQSWVRRQSFLGFIEDRIK